MVYLLFGGKNGHLINQGSNIEIKKLWQDANGQPDAGIIEIDNFLHEERLNMNKEYFRISELPSGALVEFHEKPILV